MLFRSVADGERGRLFTPFFRTADARRRGAAGVGLGLAVVARIAAAFGGTAAADGRAGGGTRVVIRLPAG